MLPESFGPGRLHYGREVTRLTVEHHRQRRKTVLQPLRRNATYISLRATTTSENAGDATASANILEIRLTCALTRAFDSLAHLLHTPGDGALQLGVLLAKTQQFVGHVERGH